MNQEEQSAMHRDMRDALERVYSEEEVGIIMDWFQTMRTGDEIELLGTRRFNAMLEFLESTYTDTFLYASMMSRMWQYAPLILERNGK